MTCAGGGYHELAERSARQTKKEVMPNLLCSTSGLLAIALSVGCLPAQHLQATAKFDNGLTASFSLTNFDTADSGSGNIYSYNGQSVNWYVQWTRDDEGNVTITYQGTLNSTLKEAAKESDGGDATLNDGNNTPGSWTRS